MSASIPESRPVNQAAQWRLSTASVEDSSRLARELGVRPLVARILIGRGFGAVDAARDFLQPALARIGDPFGMKDMDRAVERMARAVRGREKIAVFGDYDVDGLTATALMIRLFRWLGVEAESYIPHRINEGYGLNVPAVETLARRGVTVILTVDNGISSLAEARRASELGVDVVVTDHHLPGEALPEAYAVVNPNRRDCGYACSELAGVGVAFKFAHALAKGLGRDAADSKVFLKEQLDLVALGSISDIVPLLGENRILASFGLEQARQSRKAGLRAMFEVLGLEPAKLSPYTVSFAIAPRLNAAGRTEHASIALELLLTDDASRAREIVRHLDRLNDERRRIEGEILDEAVEAIEAEAGALDYPITVAVGSGWHHGVIGIVASRLVQRYGRPALALSEEDGRVKGSGRSMPGFDLVEALGACEGCLTAFGGHAMAAGFQLRADRIGEFVAAIRAQARARMGDSPPPRTYEADAEAQLPELTLECLEGLRVLEPHGNGNPRPLVAFRGVRLADNARIVGQNHLRLNLTQDGVTLGAIGFGLASHAAWLRDHRGPIEVLGSPTINDYNGRQSPEIEIKDLRPPSG